MLLPLGMKRPEIFELPGHIALALLGHPDFNESHRADLAVACYLGCDLSQDDPTINELANNGLQLLQSNSNDYDLMRYTIGTVLQWINTQPNRRVHDASMRRLKEYDEQKRVS